MSGAAYHIVARHAGASAWESFGYGVLMSTFFWEYGIEAVAETPSIQDLILTPVIGSMLGEAFIKLEEYIYENDGLLLGPRRFGQLITGVMNPAKLVLNFINSGFESPLFKSLDIFLTIGPREIFLNEQESISVEHETGISLEL